MFTRALLKTMCLCILRDAQERAIQSKVMECERERLVVKEQLALLEGTQKIEKDVRRMLWEQVEIFQGQM